MRARSAVDAAERLARSVPASAPMRSMSSAMPSIVRASASNIAMPRSRSAADLRRRRVRPRDDQVRLQHRDALEVERVDVADDRQRFDGGRIVGALDDADDRRARAGREQELGRVRREAHDASRGRWQRHRLAGVVDDANLGTRRRRPRCKREQKPRRSAGRSTFASEWRHIRQRTPANTRAPPVAKSAASS